MSEVASLAGVCKAPPRRTLAICMCLLLFVRTRPSAVLASPLRRAMPSRRSTIGRLSPRPPSICCRAASHAGDPAAPATGGGPARSSTCAQPAPTPHNYTNNIVSFYGSSCANDDKDTLNTMEYTRGSHLHTYTLTHNFS
eukprot:1187505-Prorocentrum_minimum.AAC.4